MDLWMDGWMDGEREGGTEGRTDRCMDGITCLSCFQLKKPTTALFWEEREIMAKATSDWIVQVKYLSFCNFLPHDS